MHGARWLALAIIVGLVAGFQPTGVAEGPVDAPESSAAHADLAPGEVLARWRDGPPDALLRDLGARVVEPIGDPAEVLLHVPEGTETAAAARLASSDNVVWAQPNYLRHADATPNDPGFSQQWGMQTIQAPQAWDITTGSSSVVVAVVDTGVDLSHPDLQGKIVDGKNFLDPDEPPQDDGGHGTHIAGTIAATMNNSIGIAGVAAGASIMPVKVLRADGFGRDSTVALGMRWAVDHGARIINMSFSGPELSPVLTEAVAYAQSRNVILVVAAGNEGKPAPTYPAATNPVISVAATDQRDQRGIYSNYGDWITIAAPGSNIYSTYWDAGQSAYAALSGTSMAASHVSGVVALMLSVRPELTAADVEAILRSSADPLPDAGLGAGRLNAARAVAAAAARPAASPTPAGSAPSLAATPAASSGDARSRAFAYNTPLPSTTLYLPSLLRSPDSWNSRVAIMNAAAAPAALTIRLVDPTGATPATLTSPLAPFGSTTLDLAVVQFLPATWGGAAVISSDSPVAAVVTMTRPGGNLIAYEGRGAGAAQAYAPIVFKSRNGWSTSLFVQNIGSDATTVQLAYASQNGSGAWTDSTTIPAMASKRVDQAASALPTDFAGSVTLTSLQGAPITVVVLEIHPSGNAAAYTAPLAPGSSLVAPVIFKNRSTAGTWNTGIQVQNMGADAAQVVVTYRAAGSEMAPVSERATVAPGGARTFYQPTMDQLPNGFVGSATLVVENGQPVAGLVNEVNYDRNVSSTYQLLGAGQGSLYAPLVLRNAGGLSSGVQVQNLGSGPTGVTITYRGQDGGVVAVQTDSIEPGGARSYFQPAVPGLPDGFAGSAVVSSDSAQPLAAIVNAVAY